MILLTLQAISQSMLLKKKKRSKKKVVAAHFCLVYTKWAMNSKALVTKPHSDSDLSRVSVPCYF